MKSEETESAAESVMRISYKKVFAGVGLGLIIAGLLTLNFIDLLDFLFIKWQYIFPPIIAGYYMSIQPYSKSHDASDFLQSGGMVGFIMGVFIVATQVLVTLITTHNLFGNGLASQPLLAQLAGGLLFVIMYTVLAALAHLFFARFKIKNVR
jgi:hypothetical protein